MSERRHRRPGAARRALAAGAAGLLYALLAAAAWAAAPDAGTVIQNQAAASYEPCVDDGCTAAGGVETITSNLVETVVQQVAGLSLTNDQTRPISPGGLALLPHQLVNLGNGPDRYQLCLENVDPDIVTWQVFLDADGDGQPDSTTALFDSSDPDGCADVLTPSLAPGANYDFVIEVAVGGGVPAGERPTLDIVATSDFDGALSETNTDTLEIVAGPIIEVVKRLAPVSGTSPASAVHIVIEYRNTGLADATAVEIIDALPTLTASGAPGGMTYAADSGLWSVTGTTALTDADDGSQGVNPDTIDYCAYDAIGACTDDVRFTLASVPAGASGQVEFDVFIDAGIEGDERILNDVEFSYSDATGTNQYGTPVPFRSNTVAYLVLVDAQLPAVVANNASSDGTAGTDDALDAGNVVTLASINQGQRARFDNYIWNAGDGSDVFDLIVDAQNDRLGNPLTNPFPAGTLFRLLRSDGVTPLSDSDASGMVDTGVLPRPTASGCGNALRFDAISGRCGAQVVVEAILPGSTTAADVPVDGFELTLIARSRIDSTVRNAVSDVLLAIANTTVDLTNDRAPDGSAPGEGPGPEVEPVTTRVVEGGFIASFTLVVTNTGAAADVFALVVSDDVDFGNAPFAGHPGYTARFLADGGSGDCSTTGALVSQTGQLQPGASFFACAEVSVPADAEGGEQVDLLFRVLSANTGTQDVKRDRLVVAAGPAIDVVNNETGQAEPGASVTYTHQVTNVGNLDLDNIIFSALPLPENDDGWNVVLYLDDNDDGVRDPGDPYIEPGVSMAGTGANLLLDVLEVGETVRFFAVVFAPATAAFGNSNTKTISVTGTPVGGGIDVSDAVDDITTVTSGDMSVLKEQALDDDCDGTADGPTACSGDACFRVETFQVVPGQQCVLYRLTATNSGATTLFNVRIHDTTQPFTTYLGLPAAQRCEKPSGSCDAQITAPADAGVGDITAIIGELAAGEQARLYFGLRVE